MVFKVLTLVGIIPWFASFVVANFMGKKNLGEWHSKVQLNGEALAEKILRGKSIEIKKKKSWWVGLNPHKDGKLLMASDMLEGQSLGNAVQVIHRCGLALLESVHEESVKRHYSTMRFISIIPMFLIVGAILGASMARYPVSICLAVGVWGVSLSCIACILNIVTGREAVKRALHELETKGGFRRMSEQEQLEEAAYSYVYLLALPPILAPFAKIKKLTKAKAEI